MHKTITTTAILFLTIAPAFSTDFKRTTLSAEEYLSQAQETLSRKQLTSKLTRLRDVGGYTPSPSTACVSFDKYDQFLRALSGEENFYPTKDECWRTENNQEVKATGSCSGAISGNMFNPEAASVVLVCEFSTTALLGKNVWISVNNVQQK